jgi:hypothetical protein
LHFDPSRFDVPLNLGNTVNSAVFDGGPSISADGLSLYFASARPGGEGMEDLWLATRRTIGDTFGPPVNLELSDLRRIWVRQ